MTRRLAILLWLTGCLTLGATLGVSAQPFAAQIQQALQNLLATNQTVTGTWTFSAAPGFGALTATTLDTGQGANELYDMNQHVLTTSTVTFPEIRGAAFSGEDYSKLRLDAAVDGTAGSAYINAGNATGALGAGGSVGITSGEAEGAQFSGNIDITVGDANDTDGVAGNLTIWAGEGHTPGIASVIGASGVGTNRAGGELGLYGGASTGNAAPGPINFYTSVAGASGTDTNVAAVRGVMSGTDFSWSGTLTQPAAALGTGNVTGRKLSVGRNTSGSGAAACLMLETLDGDDRFLWIDATDDLRVGSACPDEDGTPADTSGAVVGGQS